jgi:hypothetical protein
MDKNLRLEWLDPATLKPNPNNWRHHPERQKKLLDAVLQENGWAGVALYNETTGQLIDGHARRDWAIQHKEDMPVLVGKWTPAQERKILATLDPIAAMAEQADDIYRELVAGIKTENEDLQAWCDGVLADVGCFDVDEAGIPELEGGNKSPFQQITFTVHDSQAEIISIAIKKAKNEVPDMSAINENSNGNALAWICERFNHG